MRWVEISWKSHHTWAQGQHMHNGKAKHTWRKEQYKNYSNFEIATSYGSIVGLGGAGCRPSFFPFFEGLSSKTFEHYRLGDNEEQYILEQTQRYNERQIREWKRRMEVSKAGGADYSKEQAKVKEWQNKQKDLLKANPDMKRNYARENNYVTSNSKINKLKENYAMDDKGVRIKVANKERNLAVNDYETAVVFDLEGNTIFSKKGGSHEVEFTSKELALMKNAVVMHNHPQNTTFSPDDVYMLKENDLQELRVAINKGSYVLRRNENIHLMPEFSMFEQEYKKLYTSYRKSYKVKYADWKNDKDRLNRVVQMNVMDNLAKKYGLDYAFEGI